MLRPPLCNRNSVCFDECRYIRLTGGKYYILAAPSGIRPNSMLNKGTEGFHSANLT